MLTVYEEKLLEDLKYKLAKSLGTDDDVIVFKADELNVLQKYLNESILEEENHDLENDKEYLEGVIYELEGEVADREDTIADLESELELLDSNFHDLLTSNELLEEEVNELKEKLEEE